MKNAEMSFGKMKEYLTEWYYEPEFSVVQTPCREGDNVFVCHSLKENKTGEVVFVWSQEMGIAFDEKTMVSTSGVVGEELRGLIAQCYYLDKQLEESLNQTNSGNKAQKGE